MYVVRTADSTTFEFEIDGAAYQVPTLAAMPVEDVVAFADAAADGEQSAIRWLYGLFMDATGGAVAKVPGSAFGELMREWQAARPVDPGK